MTLDAFSWLDGDFIVNKKIFCGHFVFSLLLAVLLPAVSRADDLGSAPPPGFPGAAKMELWLMAGQSNVFGTEVAPEDYSKYRTQPDPFLWMHGLDSCWRPAAAPISRTYESTAAIDRIIEKKSPEEWAKLGEESRRTPQIGICPPYAFAKTLAGALGHPVGMITSAHGGSSIEMWNPKLKDKGDQSLYGATLLRIKHATQGGGRLRGVLWYQGESNAMGKESDARGYDAKFLNFVDHLRQDLSDPDLPVIYVQVGRLVMPKEFPPLVGAPREVLREEQRLAAGKRKNLYMVSVVDCPLRDNFAHISAESYRKLGQRLAEVALSKVYGKEGHGTPIEMGVGKVIDEPSALCIRIRLAGVTGKLQSIGGPPVGFELREPGSVDPAPVKFSAELDPANAACILLKFKQPLSHPLYLYYGVDRGPFPNLVDSKGMAVPAFGPIRVFVK